MIYVDTSIIVLLVITEDSGEVVEAMVLKVKPGELTTSLWTQIELGSLVARKLRMGELSAADAEAVRRELRKILDESFRLLLPTAADFATATKFLDIPQDRTAGGRCVSSGDCGESRRQKNMVAGSRIHQGRKAHQVAGERRIEIRR